MYAMRKAPAVCELDGPTITGPITSLNPKETKVPSVRTTYSGSVDAAQLRERVIASL